MMRPQQQREAEEMLDMAIALLEARGDEFGVLRLTDSLMIMTDVPVLGRSSETNTLGIWIADRAVLHAVYGDDGPPFFINFFPDAGWRWAIRRAHAALELERSNAVVAKWSETAI